MGQNGWNLMKLDLKSENIELWLQKCKSVNYIMLAYTVHMAKIKVDNTISNNKNYEIQAYIFQNVWKWLGEFLFLCL